MPNIIEVTQLTKKYKDFTAVDSISFNVERGQIFAFLGPNGAGKTTTIKMLTTLLEPTSGQIMVDNANPKTQQSEVRKAFGIVFQDQSLDDELTAWENMEFHGVLYDLPKALRRQRLQELLSFVELWERRDELVKNFSGGMKRRLEIARCLMHHPKIIFLDEPTLGLDPQTRNHIWSYIKNMSVKEGITIFFTTHYMEEADRIADKVAIIDHGKIIMNATPSEIKKSAETTTLEEAFIKLTGNNMRREEASSTDILRDQGKVWARR
jgi:ABC-2 type transport system ATP-binding protein